MVRIKSKKGSTMVEVALVFPILIFVVVTVVGFCTFMSDKILAGSKAAIIAKKHAVEALFCSPIRARFCATPLKPC